MASSSLPGRGLNVPAGAAAINSENFTFTDPLAICGSSRAAGKSILAAAEGTLAIVDLRRSGRFLMTDSKGREICPSAAGSGVGEAASSGHWGTKADTVQGQSTKVNQGAGGIFPQPGKRLPVQWFTGLEGS